MNSLKGSKNFPCYPYQVWRLAHALHRWKLSLLAALLEHSMRVVFACVIPYETSIGKNVHFSHGGLGIILHESCVIGDDVHIQQHVTIGERRGGFPVIGNNVFIGAGAKILGPIRVGNNVKIGANAVVITDVPDNATAVGVPARIIRHD